jgi:hypothetical protein
MPSHWKEKLLFTPFGWNIKAESEDPARPAGLQRSRGPLGTPTAEGVRGTAAPGYTSVPSPLELQGLLRAGDAHYISLSLRCSGCLCLSASPRSLEATGS